jgi:hypothetical protein
MCLKNGLGYILGDFLHKLPRTQTYDSWIYNATGSLARFENKKIYFEKRSSLCTTTMELYIAVNSKVVGLAPGHPAGKGRL